MKIELFSIYEHQKIPDAPGAYAFFLNMINRYSVGYLNRKAASSTKINHRELLQNKLRKIEDVYSSQKMHGALNVAGKDAHLSTSFELLASQKNLEKLESVFQALEDGELERFVTLSSYLNLFARPLYVGIAYDQTLKRRFENHKYDYDNSDDTGKFGTRLKNIKVSWSEVVFMCITSDELSGNKSLLQVVEKYLQYVANPILSVR